MTFNAPRTSATPLYAELGILKLFDLTKVMNILYVHKHLNGDLPIDTLETLEFSKINHLYGTRSNNIGLLKCANFASFTQVSSNQWNELQKTFSGTKSLKTLTITTSQCQSTTF